MTNAINVEIESEINYKSKISNVSTLQKRLEDVVSTLSSTMDEVRRLEKALEIARSNVQVYRNEQESLSQTINDDIKAIEMLKFEFINSTDNKKQKEENFKIVESLREDMKSAITKSQQFKFSTLTSLTRQQDEKSRLERKLNQLSQKKITLESVYAENQLNWKNRIKQLKQQRFDLINNINKKNQNSFNKELEEMRVQSGLRKKELARMEEERKLLLKQQEEDDKKLRIAEEKAKNNFKGFKK